MSIPFVPPIETEDLPAVGGRIGDEPEHFLVEEIPAYEPSGEGEHAYFWVEKRLQNTRDVAGYLARAAGVPIREVGYAGLKDRRAVTRQWFSLPVRSRPLDEWQLPDGVKVLTASRHKNKLRTGHLIGNRFSLGFVDVPEGGKERAERILERIGRGGVGNYFGPQRFGRGGQNLPAALAWLRDGAWPPRGTDPKLLSSVLQSEHFNRYAAQRLAQRSRLLLGDVVRLAGSGAHFVVEDAEVEQPRLDAGDIVLTGPMIGPRGLQAKGAARELELEIARQLELTSELLERLGEHAPGTRRDLILVPSEVTLTEPAPGRLDFSFRLPSGAYATQIARELSRSPWDSPRSPGDG
jgi:tRNA pseudouridine13 synthase